MSNLERIRSVREDEHGSEQIRSSLSEGFERHRVVVSPAVLEAMPPPPRRPRDDCELSWGQNERDLGVSEMVGISEVTWPRTSIS